MPTFEQGLQWISTPDLQPILNQIRRGIEKEGLRIEPSGHLSQKPHPRALGSALTHPYITTDYSEALLEFITPVMQTAEASIEFLKDIHSFTYQHLDHEMIWCASMPCPIEGEAGIPIAEYGESNIGRLKHIYRVGLAWRYGKIMQTIAGIHYNFSMPDEFWPVFLDKFQQPDNALNRTEQYFGLIRNFMRHSWLLLYLFGASPALCRCFLQGRPHQMQESNGSLYLPYATSLRMGDLGYQNNAQQSLNIGYNSLESYVTSLGQAMTTPFPAYQAIGVKRDGEYRQINSNILQIENEYYSEIRPKRVTPSGKKPLQILKNEGVQYIEVRNLDINPFLEVGIDESQIHFVDTFLLTCLLRPSPATNTQEKQRLLHNKNLVVNQGRKPGLTLLDEQNNPVLLTQLAEDFMSDMLMVADCLDRNSSQKTYRCAVEHQRQMIYAPDQLPSARLVARLREDGQSYFDIIMQQSAAQANALKQRQLGPDRQQNFTEEASQSLLSQEQIEAEDRLSFDEFLQAYLQQ